MSHPAGLASQIWFEPKLLHVDLNITNNIVVWGQIPSTEFINHACFDMRFESTRRARFALDASTPLPFSRRTLPPRWAPPPANTPTPLFLCAPTPPLRGQTASLIPFICTGVRRGGPGGSLQGCLTSSGGRCTESGAIPRDVGPHYRGTSPRVRGEGGRVWGVELHVRRGAFSYERGGGFQRGTTSAGGGGGPCQEVCTVGSSARGRGGGHRGTSLIMLPVKG